MRAMRKNTQVLLQAITNTVERLKQIFSLTIEILVESLNGRQFMISFLSEFLMSNI